jgi:hypothetical protein
MGSEAELLVNGSYPTGLLTSYLHPDVKREGLATDFMLKDNHASNSVITRMGGATSKMDYGAYLSSFRVHSDGCQQLPGKYTKISLV